MDSTRIDDLEVKMIAKSQANLFVWIVLLLVCFPQTATFIKGTLSHGVMTDLHVGLLQVGAVLVALYSNDFLLYTETLHPSS